MSSDAPITLDTVRPLILRVATRGRSLTVHLRCPVTGATEVAHWRAPPIGASAVTAQLERASATYRVRHQVNGLVRDLLGFGAVGRAARQLSDLTLAGEHPDATLSADEEERGVVEAFRSVASRFQWTGGRWRHRGASAGEDRGAALEATLLDGPALTAYDRDVAARMAVEVATVHGAMEDEERTHLLHLLGDAQSIEALLRRPPLTDAELAETSRGAPRHALLAATWSMALCDERFDPEEERLLERFGRALGLTVEERVAVRHQAQVYVIEQLLERVFAFGGHDAAARTQLERLADRIGVDRASLARIEARYQRRRAEERA